MSMHVQQARLRSGRPERHLRVFRAADFRVIDGVNEGDPLSDASDLLHEDIYALADRADPVRLCLAVATGTGPLQVGPDSAAGRPGAPVFLDCLVTFIGATGGTLEALVLVETDPDGLISDVYLHPFAALVPGIAYALVAIDRAGAAARFAGRQQNASTRGRQIARDGGAAGGVPAWGGDDQVRVREL